MIRRTLCALALALAFAITAVAAADSPAIGTWEGKLPNGMGGEIRVVLKIAQAADGLTATMDSPDQGATDIPVKKVTLEAEKFSLDVAAVSGSYEGTLDAAKGEISGTWRQSGQELPLVLKKQAAKK